MKNLTFKEFEVICKERYEKSRKTLIEKGKEYATEDNAMDSFHEQASLSMHDKPTSVAWELMVKHLYSVRRMISEYENKGTIPTSYMINEKIGDALNYLILIEALFEEIRYNHKEEL